MFKRMAEFGPDSGGRVKVGNAIIRLMLMPLVFIYNNRWFMN